MAEFLENKFQTVEPGDRILLEMNYKGYSTHISYSFEDKIWYGKVEGIPDLVSFEAKDREGFEKAFHEAVEDYLAFCKDIDIFASSSLYSHETKR